MEEDHTLKYLLVGKGRGVRAVPATQVEKASSGSPSINLGLAEVEALPPYSSDHEALRKAQAALEKADSFDGGTFGAVSVEVTLGIAHLNGNVRFPSESEDAEKAVAEAPGVLEVVNDLVADWDLHIQVAEALAQEGLTRQGMVTVKSRLGNVTLGGYLPSTEAIGRAARVAEGVPGTGSVKHEIEMRVPKSQEATSEMAADAEDDEESTPGEALDASSDHISESSTPG